MGKFRSISSNVDAGFTAFFRMLPFARNAPAKNGHETSHPLALIREINQHIEECKSESEKTYDQLALCNRVCLRLLADTSAILSRPCHADYDLSLAQRELVKMRAMYAKKSNELVKKDLQIAELQSQLNSKSHHQKERH